METTTLKKHDRVKSKATGVSFEVIEVHECWVWLLNKQGGSLQGQIWHVSDIEPIPPAPVWPEKVTLVLHPSGLVSLGSPMSHETDVVVRTIDLREPSLEAMGKAGVVVYGTHTRFYWQHMLNQPCSESCSTWDEALADARKYFIEKGLGK